MPDLNGPIVVAGHVCLDVIPAIAGALPKPGGLTEVGAARISGGGAVSNVGLALHRLGLPVRLAGLVGDDLFGSALRHLFDQQGGELGAGIQVRKDVSTSYSIVLDPPQQDRSFLHCPGANHAFLAQDVRDEQLSSGSILHFGYPPLMRRIWADGGEGLADLFERARRLGLLTSLDLAMPDAGGESGKVDWRSFLKRVLPQTGVFLPSVDEVRVVLGAETPTPQDESDLSRLADELLAMGAAVVGLKLGERGLYLRTASPQRVAEAGLKPTWADRELLARCLTVEAVGATGSGDCTIAGFLAALWRGATVEGAIEAATAVGACSVEVADATSGIPTWEALQQRLGEGWPRHALPAPTTLWRETRTPGVWRGPSDVGG